ncbi:MAG TPA: hypothetical protein VFH31_10860, partial [Pyrinomonadaceae bacterium]|nr:hypothetical protein [Pyrinomonadaceae bacterium]
MGSATHSLAFAITRHVWNAKGATYSSQGQALSTAKNVAPGNVQNCRASSERAAEDLRIAII